MIIAGVYSFKRGQAVIESRFPAELQEIEQIIASVDGAAHKVKVSREKTMTGRELYSPQSLNRAFGRQFEARRWQKYRLYCEYPHANGGKGSKALKSFPHFGGKDSGWGLFCGCSNSHSAGLPSGRRWLSVQYGGLLAGILAIGATAITRRS